MSTTDHPDGPARRTAGPALPPAARRDVVSARSRMRTKYGAQREIERVAGSLQPDEELLHLAVTRGRPRTTGRAAHGLLALSDLRLQYVAKASAPAQDRSIPLAAIGLLTWSPDPDGPTGTLSVVAADGTHAYAGVNRSDGRDIVAGIRAVRPAVQYAESPGR